MVHLTDEGRAALDKLVVGPGNCRPKDAQFRIWCGTAEGELYFNGGGYRVKDNPTSGAIDPNCVFRLYSQTKTITHLTALHLIENGDLSEADPVSKFLPEFSNLVVLSDPLAEKPTYAPTKTTMTVKHLLNFSSGLNTPVPPEYAMLLGPVTLAPHDKEDPIGGFLKILKGDYPGIPLVHEPGTDFAYGWSSDILGFVVEKATGMSLEAYMRKYILDPLGVKGSFYLNEDLKSKFVGIVKKDPSTGELELAGEDGLYNIDPNQVSRHMGGCGMYSSARDYLKLLRHLLEIQNGTAQNPIISASTLSTAFSPALTEKGQKSLEMTWLFDPFSPKEKGIWLWTNVFSVTTRDWPGRRRKGTGCWGGWANTYHFNDPTTGVAVVFQTQFVPGPNKDILEYYSEFEKVLYAGLE